MTWTRPGRRRSDDAGPALLATTRRLVIERGYQAVTITDIAQSAGTGRQTLYRRWPGKAELVLDAFSYVAMVTVDDGNDGNDPPGDAAVPDRDLVGVFLQRTFRALADSGPAMRGLMAHAQQDPEFQALFRERFILPRRASLRAVLERAQASGELAAGLDLDTAVSALYGGLWYRLLLGEPLDDSYARALSRLLTGPRGDG
jgi:AcrR family transcriptional regulator